MFFKDRRDAGEKLVSSLLLYKEAKNTVVLGLARGGLAVSTVVAKKLSLPLSVVVPRKLGAPGNKELAIGAIAEGNVVLLNEKLIHYLQVSPQYLEKEIAEQQTVAADRLKRFRKVAPLPSLKDWQVILVDDGIATGATMLAVIESMRKAGVKKIIVAVPTASTSAFKMVEEKADEVISLIVDEDFQAVGQYYDDFDQVEDTEVIDILKENKRETVDQ